MTIKTTIRLVEEIVRRSVEIEIVRVVPSPIVMPIALPVTTATRVGPKRALLLAAPIVEVA
jgi:hypothetical protein